MIVDFFTDFIGMYSMIVCVLGPSFLGGYLIYSSTGDSATGILGGVLIFVLASIVSFVILGLLY
jgi:hypothetical protein